MGTLLQTASMTTRGDREVLNSILNPERPSSYNNRAQALRMVGRPDSALKDLDTAIQLSKGKGKAGSNALCQRGVLLRKEGRDDDAMEDFKTAAKNGSGFAKAMVSSRQSTTS